LISLVSICRAFCFAPPSSTNPDSSAQSWTGHLDQAWLLGADLSDASLKGANVFAAQMQGAKLDGADFSNSRLVADLTGAKPCRSLVVRANLSPDMKNQSMGLMRAVLKSAKLERVDARGADLSRANLEFASLKGADLTAPRCVGRIWQARSDRRDCHRHRFPRCGPHVDQARCTDRVDRAKNLTGENLQRAIRE